MNSHKKELTAWIFCWYDDRIVHFLRLPEVQAKRSIAADFSSSRQNHRDHGEEEGQRLHGHDKRLLQLAKLRRVMSNRQCSSKIGRKDFSYIYDSQQSPARSNAENCAHQHLETTHFSHAHDMPSNTNTSTSERGRGLLPKH